MSKRFLSIGECMVEMAPTVDGTFAMGFAGDTLNTAWYLRKLLEADWDVSYLTAVGQDAISQRMVSFLNEAGLGTQSIRQLSDKTVGLYMISLENGERSFSYWRSDSAAKQIAADKAFLSQELSAADVAYFSGISIAILSEGDRATFLQAVADVRAKGVKVVFDTNLRPRLWSSNAAMCEGIMQAAQVADIVLPSYDDEAAYFGDASLQETAERYARAGAECVIVKNGAGDILSLVSGEEQTHSAQKAEGIVDTTAAGDSFNAGFLAAYLNGSALNEAIQQGAFLAAQVIGQRGALVDVSVRQ